MEEALMTRIAEELPHGSIDVRELVDSYYPNDIEAGRLLTGLFDAWLLRGCLSTNFVEFDGLITGIGAGTRAVLR